MKHPPVEVTYLEMLSPPGQEVPSPPPQTQIVHAVRPTIAFYRFLYDAVGNDWNWIDRKLLSDEQLGQVIHDERVEVHVLYAAGVPAGYVELDRRVEGEVELGYFGLVPEFLGQGLGGYFLRWAVARAWSYRPRRVWVHTCELDHAAALPVYLKAGFEVYDKQTIQQVMGEGTG